MNQRQLYQTHFLILLAIVFLPAFLFASTEKKRPGQLPTLHLKKISSQTVPLIQERCRFEWIDEHTYESKINPDPENTTCLVLFSPNQEQILTITPDLEWGRIRKDNQKNEVLNLKTQEKDPKNRYHSQAHLWTKDLKTSVLLKDAHVGYARGNTVSWSGSHLAILGSDQKIRIFDTQQGMLIDSFQVFPEASEEDQYRISVSLSKTLLAVAYQEKLHLFSLDTKKHEVYTYEQKIIQMKWSPDEEKLAVVFHKENEDRWEEANSLTVLSPAYKKTWVRKVRYEPTFLSWSPDGKWLVMFGFEGEGLVAVDTRFGKKVWSLEQVKQGRFLHWYVVHSLSWMPKQPYFLSAADFDKTFYIYNQKQRKVIGEFISEEPLLAATFLPSKEMITIDNQGTMTTYEWNP